MVSLNKTEPIKDLSLIKKLGNHLKENYTAREYILFRSMLYLALRTQDILSLQVEQIRGKYQIHFKEQKTGKTKLIEVHPELQREIEVYTKNMEDTDYLFPSQKGKAISREHAFRLLQQAGQDCGLPSLSGHVLRKTFCYHSYQNGTPLHVLSELLNHSSEKVTRRYIGLEQEDIKQAYYAVNF
ncbi:tyrosine-type recombinase/integrase [Peribacillus butanolivorans]|uniref:tyrosine-type recombinase/integrase n=1 Tax=Peribacillus butanolivorans TaxID=421767 RepID=UPI003697E1CB